MSDSFARLSRSLDHNIPLLVEQAGWSAPARIRPVSRQARPSPERAPAPRRSRANADFRRITGQAVLRPAFRSRSRIVQPKRETLSAPEGSTTDFDDGRRQRCDRLDKDSTPS